MEINALFSKRLKKIVKFSYFLQAVPFVEALFLNGSLPQGKAKASSDIDILVITERKRLYTTRFFVIILGFLSGQKRSKSESKPHAGKFCFNYFLSQDFLKIPTGRGEAMDLYCAKNYSKSVLVWGDKKIFTKFFKVNESLFSKVPHSFSNLDEELQKYFPVRGSFLMQRPKSVIEKLLSGRFGDWLELRLKSLQIKLINRDSRTAKYPKLIVCNDREARFHPPKASDL